MKAIEVRLNGKVVTIAGMPDEAILTIGTIWESAACDQKVTMLIAGLSDTPAESRTWATPKIGLNDAIELRFVDAGEGAIDPPIAPPGRVDLNVANRFLRGVESSSPGQAETPAESALQNVRTARRRVMSKLHERDLMAIAMQERIKELSASQSSLETALHAENKDNDEVNSVILQERQETGEKIAKEEARLQLHLNRRAAMMLILNHVEDVMETLRDRDEWSQCCEAITSLVEAQQGVVLLKARMHLANDGVSWEDLTAIVKEIERKTTNPA